MGPEETPVLILCGGRGTRLQHQGESIPKALVEIGGMPIVWHVVQCYLAAGFREVWPGDLPSIAAQLRAIPGERGYWGRWRAVAHDVVDEYFLMVNCELSIVNG